MNIETFASDLLRAAVRKQHYERWLRCRNKRILGESLYRGIQSSYVQECFFIGELLAAIKRFKRL